MNKPYLNDLISTKDCKSGCLQFLDLAGSKASTSPPISRRWDPNLNFTTEQNSDVASTASIPVHNDSSLQSDKHEQALNICQNTETSIVANNT